MSFDIANRPPRSTRSFPTRTASYAATAGISDISLQAGAIHRFIAGIDNAPVALGAAEAAAQLGDPFAQLVLLRGAFPMTLDALLHDINSLNAEQGAVPEQTVFLAGDGSQIPWTPETRDVSRELRLVIVRSRGGVPLLMVSTGTRTDSEEVFLQVLAWDEVHGVYHYYARHKPAWAWAGNSWHAFDMRSRGKGCFDSHVSGSLVMKELKAPWLHWHSSRASIVPEAFAPDDPFLGHPLFQARANAELLENTVVRPGIVRWTAARIDKLTRAPGKIEDLHALFAHLLDGTNAVNLATSDRASSLVRRAATFRLPIEFFLNRDGLIDLAGLQPDIAQPMARGDHYLDALESFDFNLAQGSARVQSGDTHFAFAVPEPAFEDLAVVTELVARGILSRRLVAALLMVDFPNPVFSDRRRALLQYAPQRLDYAGPADQAVEAAFLGAINASTHAQGSPEREFLDNWAAGGQWEKNFATRIEQYFAHVATNLQSRAIFLDYVRLADSRRNAFRKLPLAEFDLTLPRTNLEHPRPLRMTETATVA